MDIKEKLIPFPVLKGDRIALRQVELSDAEDMFKMVKDRELTTHLVWEPHENLQETYDFINSFIGGYKTGDCTTWAIVNITDDSFLGLITLRVANTQPRGELGYWIGKSFWGKGYMTEAINLLIEFCFMKLNLNRIQAVHFVENPASGRVMEKAGMTFEGVLREYIFCKEKFHDVKLYAILKNEVKNNERIE